MRALRHYLNTERVAHRLEERGLGAAVAIGKAFRFTAMSKALIGAGMDSRETALGFHVPGRIEVLGKHTDYAGGRSIVAATDAGCCFLAVPRDIRELDLLDADSGESLRLEIRDDLEITPGHWSMYPATVVRRLASNFPGALRSASIAFSSDLPAAAGMSSSSVLVTGTFLALSHASRLHVHPAFRRDLPTREDLAAYLGTVENGQSFGTLGGDRGVGTFGGSEDHTAILCSQAGNLGQYAFDPITRERNIRCSGDLVFAVASSGIRAHKGSGERDRFNRLAREIDVLLSIWRESTGRDSRSLAAALGGSRAAYDALRAAVSSASRSDLDRPRLLDRLEQFYRESEEIIPAVPACLTDQTLPHFGELVDTSQSLGATLLGNQTPETTLLARAARELGAPAASAFGAGFGGSVWALVSGSEARDFLLSWSRRYHESFPAHAPRSAFFLTPPAPPAFSLDETQTPED